MELYLHFLGAVRNVTGSAHLLEVDGKKILVDCGMYQERQFLERNWGQFPIDPADIDAVILTHAHLDHCGLVPRLVAKGFKGPVFCTQATKEIAQLVMLDSAQIQQEDAEFKKARHKKEGRTVDHPVEPLYTVPDAQNAIRLLKPVHYELDINIVDGVTATFHEAGHILGSSMVMVKVQLDGQMRKILFSGDVGRFDKPILQDPTLFEEADYVLVESTYGDSVHGDQAQIKDQLCQVINDTKQAGGNIIIPSFAIERSQEVLYYLNELLMEDRIPHLMVFVDSPLAFKVTKVFRTHPELFDEEMTELMENHNSPFDFSKLRYCKTRNDSKSINHITGTVIIIAGAGMCTGGRVKHHLAKNISRSQSTILFVGYQAEGTLGREIVEGAQAVRILGTEQPVRANIVKIDGFSAHADKNEMLNWLKSLKQPPKQVFVIHGEESASHAFCDFLKEKTGWNVVVPEYKQKIQLD